MPSWSSIAKKQEELPRTPTSSALQGTSVASVPREVQGGNIEASVEVPWVTLRDGTSIPVIGMGTSFFTDEGMDLRRSKQGDASCEDEIFRLTTSAVLEALAAGVKLFDLSHLYQNTMAVAYALHEAIDAGFVCRDELFLCMKLMSNDDGSNLHSLTQHLLEAMQLEWFDLALLYSPAKPHMASTVWAAMGKLVHEGFVRSIGLSNHYEPDRIEPLLLAEIPPVINQIEVHSFQLNLEVVRFCQTNDMHVMAHSPLGAPNKVRYFSNVSKDRRIEQQFTLLEHSAVKRAAQRHGKTAAQVLLRWQVQKGYIPIPKSYDLCHVQENAKLFDFLLDDDEVQSLDGLHAGISVVQFYHAANHMKKDAK